MQFEVHTDNHINGTDRLQERVLEWTEHALGRFKGRVTRVAIHLGDEVGNGHQPHDKRCMIEARMEGRQPSAVTHHADSIEQAVRGAAQKMARLLDHEIGRLEARR